jgi:hypothetical protein
LKAAGIAKAHAIRIGAGARLVAPAARCGLVSNMALLARTRRLSDLSDCCDV